MANKKISQLTTYAGDPTGTWLVIDNAGQTGTFKIERENFIGGSGSSGTSGTSGISGTSGSSGSSGTSGTSGVSGTSGSSGTSGVSGTSGSSGTSGISGTSGSSGTSGTSGVNGVSGTSGSSGTSGINGTSGSSGTSGTSGTSGVDGDSFFIESNTLGGNSFVNDWYNTSDTNGDYQFILGGSGSTISASSPELAIINSQDSSINTGNVGFVRTMIGSKDSQIKGDGTMAFILGGQNLQYYGGDRGGLIGGYGNQINGGGGNMVFGGQSVFVNGNGDQFSINSQGITFNNGYSNTLISAEAHTINGDSRSGYSLGAYANNWQSNAEFTGFISSIQSEYQGNSTTRRSSIIGSSSSIISSNGGESYSQVILGSHGVQIKGSTNQSNNSFLSSNGGTISGAVESMVASSQSSSITGGENGTIIGSFQSQIVNSNLNNTIIGGNNTTIEGSTDLNTIIGSTFSTIQALGSGGDYDKNTIIGSNSSNIISQSGNNNLIVNSGVGTIGSQLGDSQFNTIMGSQDSTLTATTGSNSFNTIIGASNSAGITGTTGSDYNAIIGSNGGKIQLTTGDYNAILFGQGQIQGTIGSRNIIMGGGSTSIIQGSGTNNLILGQGQITGTSSNNWNAIVGGFDSWIHLQTGDLNSTFGNYQGYISGTSIQTTSLISGRLTHIYDSNYSHHLGGFSSTIQNGSHTVGVGLSGRTISSPLDLTTYVENSFNYKTESFQVYSGGTVSGSIDVDCTLGTLFYFEISGDTTPNFVNPRDGQRFVFVVYNQSNWSIPTATVNGVSSTVYAKNGSINPTNSGYTKYTATYIAGILWLDEELSFQAV